MTALARAAAEAETSATESAERRPSIYYLQPPLAGPVAEWGSHFERAARLGFSHVLIAPLFEAGTSRSIFLAADLNRTHPSLKWPGDSSSALRRIAADARAHGLEPLLDVVLDRVAANSVIAHEQPAFRPPDPSTLLDPRAYGDDADAAIADTSDDLLRQWWGERLAEWARAGFSGFRLIGLSRFDSGFTAAVISELRKRMPHVVILGDTVGIPISELRRFRGIGLDFVFSSLPFWDWQGDWIWQEAQELQRIAPIIMSPGTRFAKRAARRELSAAQFQAFFARAIRFSGLVGTGWLVSMELEFSAAERTAPPLAIDREIAAVNTARRSSFNPGGGELLRVLTPAQSPAIAILRFNRASAERHHALMIIASRSLHQTEVTPAMLLADSGTGYVPSAGSEAIAIAPGDVISIPVNKARQIGSPARDLETTARTAASMPRIAIDNVTPTIDNGKFTSRRIVGDLVTVEADVICDGHDLLKAAVLWRGCDCAEWEETSMDALGNNRWRAQMPLFRMGAYEFSVLAWLDVFGTFREALAKKIAAGMDTAVEQDEGRILVTRAVCTSESPYRAELLRLQSVAASATGDALRDLLLAEETERMMANAGERAFAVDAGPFPVFAERPSARFASWYELFPRSMSNDPKRHGTFRDVIAHLNRIRDMGFDTLYFPPIHPIGQTNRKGPNNALYAKPGAPGSPYAIGSVDGGHTAIHRELGSLTDFRELRDAAAEKGIEIALDFAIQCSPDHPWLTDHKEWFFWRPDRSVKYAENPPKKYEDIVNVDFYAPGAIPSLWVALCEVVLFWAAEGIRAFRVDNPHTKPLPFWTWMIAEVRARFPDVIFLSEAFTAPKMMYWLAKAGFSQSYTYFTWRNTKQEIRTYIEELASAPVSEFFRPNFFVNTPDINPSFLHHSGRAGFLIRASLACTLSGLWGMYSGFELCEAHALPDREEYADSEKYEIKAWDWNRPGNITAEIAALNAIRAANPALHTHFGVTFLNAWNDSIVYFEKATPNRDNVLLIAVSVDPFNIQEADFEVPVWRWGLPDHARVDAEDLLSGTQTTWNGKIQHMRLDPNTTPYAIWRVRPTHEGADRL